ncbi:MAG: ribbon-helix-helix protein, CopG family [Rhodococcus sp. (in: high G+C Gram-positive bacteria)]
MSDSPRNQSRNSDMLGTGRSGAESLVKTNATPRRNLQYTLPKLSVTSRVRLRRPGKKPTSTPISLRLDEDETRDLQLLMTVTGLNRSDAIRLALHEVAEAQLTARLREQSELSRTDPAEELDRAELDELLPSVGFYDDAPDETADAQANEDRATE